MTVHEPFYINFEQSGGFTGMTSSIEIFSDSLSNEEAEKLSSLIDGSGFFEIQKQDIETGNLPDQFLYKLTIEQNNKRQTIELNDSSIPDTLRPLIQYLSREARRKRK